MNQDNFNEKTDELRKLILVLPAFKACEIMDSYADNIRETRADDGEAIGLEELRTCALENLIENCWDTVRAGQSVEDLQWYIDKARTALLLHAALQALEEAYSAFGDVLEGMDPDDDLGHWKKAGAAQSAARQRLRDIAGEEAQA